MPSWKRHLRAEPHRIKGDGLRSIIELLSGYDLRPVEALRQGRPDRARPCRPIEGLAVFTGYRCMCDDDCDFCTRRLAKMHDHMPTHGRKGSEHQPNNTPLWRACKLQTYFTAKGLIDYFIVDEGGGEVERSSSSSSRATPARPGHLTRPSSREGKLFDELREDWQKASDDLEEKAAIVQDLEGSRADRAPWLVYTGFPTYLGGLRDAEIRSSYKLPPRKLLQGGHRDEDDGGGSGEEEDTDLIRILVAAEAVLRDAYGLCSDRSPERKMTQQRAKRLNDFTAGAPWKGKAEGFRSFKNASTLTTYFRRMKQLLAYYYRVVFCEDGHFTRGEDPDQAVPQDMMEPTGMQQQAMEEIIRALREQDEDEDEEEDEEDERDRKLKHAIRNLYVALICQTVGSMPFRSPVLSFCAMLSRTSPKGGKRKESIGDGEGRARKQCVWEEPGNYNCNLSALIWTAQLILFDFVCFHKQDDEDGIPDLLEKMCRTFFQQMAESPFGYILQWRLYLFTVSKAAITRNQARWSLDGERIDYMGTRLHMEQVSQLVLSEYRQAYTLLYDELLFGAADDLTPIEAWRLYDDLDVEDYGGSWLTDARNAEVLDGTRHALLRQIEGRERLRRVFVREDDGGGGKGLCRKAMAIYEAHVQEFLRRMVTLIHISPCPPLRAPELLSVTYCNTGRRRRCILLWEKMVMLYVRYHKNQEQWGAEKDNIRFLPRAVGDLLVTYLALVQPLRQTFLRQSKPGALLSPYLWSTLEGEVWRDTAVSSCLRKACARAEVPPFQVAWWRQAAASITKEKFSAKERANFDMGGMADAATEEVEDEADLVVLAEASNHSYHTFNHAYAGTTTLAMSTLLHRAYRASQSWRDLFRVDQVLQGTRPRAVSETQALGILRACKKTRLRTRPTQKEDGLLAVARRLYDDPALQFRRPGQREAVLATMGPRAAEQVIAVLATGSGKTLIAMVAAALAGAGTTIFILPTVALRTNMLDRLGRVAVKHVVWSPGSTKAAALVLASVEAACTEGFLGFAHRLADRQQLDRIVIDECHLTITASDYRRCMSQLGWFVRRVPTQTVWLTATLPPAFEEVFIEHNKLVRPRIVRESTNRPNLRYVVRREQGRRGTLCERAARLVQACCRRDRTEDDLPFEGGRDRIILYCQTKGLAAELATLLGCPSYTSDSGTEQEKAAILEQWLGAAGSPAIVATSALGVGFDYPHVRSVIHVGAPSRMTDFSQETGRAGRDGRAAESITLLNATWEPQLERPLGADEESMQLYLTQRYCLRGVMSQFLDARRDWRWCMEGEDELCGVCPQHQTEQRPGHLEFHLPRPDVQEAGAGEGEGEGEGEGGEVPIAREMDYTGPSEVLRQTRVCDEALSRYERDLETMAGCCLYCRVGGRPFEHTPMACSRRHNWIQAKKKALQTCQKEGRQWTERYVVCWRCYQPQVICRAAEGETECRFRDMVMPLCYGAFYRCGRTRWFQKHFQQVFRTEHEYMLWLGETASLGGDRCIQANCVAARILEELGQFEGEGFPA